MKSYLKIYPVLFSIALLLCSESFGQVQASTMVEKKNFLIEKGTGHVCGSCPEINLRCDSVIDSHPGKGMLIEYHFGPDAYPQGPPLDQDFTTPYGDTIFEPSMLNWPFYLNMMVNRRDQGIPYGSTFIFGVNDNQVQREADAVVNQNADVNLALASTFDPATRLLTIYTDAYYTSTSATPLNFLQIVLTEDSITGMQYDGNYPLNNNFNPNFQHMNTFRENINGFRGDTIRTTSAGTRVSNTYYYTIPAFYKNVACDPDHCKLTVYMAEERTSSGVQSFTGKVMNSVRGKIGTTVTTAMQSPTDNSIISIYPNPTNGMLHILDIEKQNEPFLITNILGTVIYRGICQANETSVDLTNQPAGIYFMNFKFGEFFQKF